MSRELEPTPDLAELKKRVAELEAELADEILSSNSLRSSAEALSSDLASVTRERDGALEALELAAARDLEHHKRIEELESEVKFAWSDENDPTAEDNKRLKTDIAAVTRERDELKARHGTDCVSAFARIDSLTRELAEAKQTYERMLAESNADCTRQCERANAAEAEAKALSEQAARHKVDEAHADHVTIELQRELAEAREELLNANNAGRGPRPTNPYNREEEAAYRVGWQNGADTIEAWHRVVSVEPEKAQSKCARCGGEGMLLPLRDGVQCPDCDGGGERSGQPAFDRAEKPLLGPHAETVADLEAFLEWALPHAWREWREIRAWRAGSKTNDERTETDSF